MLSACHPERSAKRGVEGSPRSGQPGKPLAEILRLRLRMTGWEQLRMAGWEQPEMTGRMLAGG